MEVAKHRRTTPRGILVGRSDVVEWTITDFFSLDETTLPNSVLMCHYIESPLFELAGCSWQLEVFPKGKGVQGWVSAYVNVYGDRSKDQTFVLGWKRADGIVEEKVRSCGPVLKGGAAASCFTNFLSLDELEKRKSELAPSGELTLTCRVDSKVLRAPVPFRVLQDPWRSTAVGAVDLFSETILWKIPAFFSLEHEYIQSPLFLLADCRWQLTLYPNSGKRDGHLSIYLRREVPDIPPVAETRVYVGLRRKNGTLEERKSGSTGDFIVEGFEFFWGWSDFFDLDELRRRKFELTRLGNLTVSCRMERAASTRRGSPSRTAQPIKRRFDEDVPKNSEKMSSQPKMVLDPEAPLSDLKNLLGNGTCDVSLNVQDREFRAHRSVLSAGSPVFRAMFQHDTSEAETGVLTIPDCDPDPFGEFLSFLYTGKMQEVSQSSASSLYVTADKYDVRRLKKFCADYLAQTLTTENVCDVIALAELHSDDRLLTSTQLFFNRNYPAISLTPAWSSLVENNPRLADKLVEEMAAAPEEPSRIQIEQELIQEVFIQDVPERDVFNAPAEPQRIRLPLEPLRIRYPRMRIDQEPVQDVLDIDVGQESDDDDDEEGIGAYGVIEVLDYGNILY